VNVAEAAMTVTVMAAVMVMTLVSVFVRLRH
jgi:hypothetical protein